MKYAAQLPCSSQRDFDFSSVESTLLPYGFSVQKKDKTSIDLSGRGMNSTKEDPIRGASEITLIAKAGTLQLKAKLGGVVFMSLFVCFLPPLLILCLSFFNPSDSGVINHLWVWFIMGPIISYWIRRRTINALNILLEDTLSFDSNNKMG